MKLYLDGQKFNSKEELHSFLADKLNFPSYYGNNLDALYDCLTDITYPLLLVASHMEQYEGFLCTIADAAKVNRNIILKVQV